MSNVSNVTKNRQPREVPGAGDFPKLYLHPNKILLCSNGFLASEFELLIELSTILVKTIKNSAAGLIGSSVEAWEKSTRRWNKIVCSVVEGSGFVTVGVRRVGVVGRVGVRDVGVRLEELVVGLVGVRGGVLTVVG